MEGMKPITTYARKLVYDLLDLMPSVHQQASLKAMLALFLQARGMALPEHAERKSPSALSRFLNLYGWPTRAVIQTLRRHVLQRLLERRKAGRKPILRAIVDLSTLEKSGKFEGLGGLVRVLNKKRGLQLVVLYVELDGWRVPWGFRLWRGKGSDSPGALALKIGFARCRRRSPLAMRWWFWPIRPFAGRSWCGECAGWAITRWWESEGTVCSTTGRGWIG